MKTSIIIPVYNEEERIKKAVTSCKALNIDKEIIVVDDGSTDNTWNILQTIPDIKLFRHEKNRGKGAAWKTGVENAIGDIVIPFDADNEFFAEEIKEVIEPIKQGKTDVVFGSRWLDERNERGGLSFYLGGKALTKAANLFYPGSKLTDEATCYKATTRKLFTDLQLKADRFELEPEMVAKIWHQRKGLFDEFMRIHEIPVTYRPRKKTEGKKIKWQDGVTALWTLFKYSNIWKEAIKFVVIGGIAAIINLTITYSLTEFIGLWYMFSVCCGISFAAIFSFIGYKLWAFKNG